MEFRSRIQGHMLESECGAEDFMQEFSILDTEVVTLCISIAESPAKFKNEKRRKLAQHVESICVWNSAWMLVLWF